MILLVLGLDTTIGLGVFVGPGTLAKTLGPASCWLFPVGGILLSVVALAFASLGRLTSRNGGPYIYARKMMGRRIGFVLGWADWLAGGVGFGLLASAFVKFLPLSSWGLAVPPAVLTSAVILAFTAVNLIGIRLGAAILVACTVLKLLPLVALAVAGTTLGGLAPVVLRPASSGWSVPAVTDGLILVLFMCQGFEWVPAIAGEVRQPRRQVPRAVLGTLWLAITLYTVLQYLVLIHPGGADGEPALFTLGERLWGSAGGLVLRAAMSLSLLGLVAARALSAPRLLLPMLEDFTPRLARREISIALTAVVALLFSFLDGIKSLIELSALGAAFQYLMVSMSLFLLARRHQRSRQQWLAIGSALISLFLLSLVSLATWKIFAAGFVVGFVLYSALESGCLYRLTPVRS